MKYTLSKFVLIAVAIFTTSVAVIAQEPPAGNLTPSETPSPNADVAKDGRQGMLMQIGLTREQFRQIQMLNMRHRPTMMAAQKRLREATVALDLAIYADLLAEGEFETKLKEQQLAQAEVIRVRSLGELAIRKILTPEQLVKFRELRQQFENMRRENVQRRIGDSEPNGVRRNINRPKMQPSPRPVNR